ncbi:hypothetical protein AB1Y20_012555 [Prymnesium parvum]|uniref:Nucleotide-diphospho-sugar transferase domain-containing protein n=1 Tax=Prymnesium parvum TaxID=97485 RepID=A0AB34IKW2_PRYPA
MASERPTLRRGSANRSAAARLLYQDIHAPLDLLAPLAAARHWEHELILLTSNWPQYDLAVNLISSLHRLGLQHYLLLADNAALARHAARRGAVAAVWSSLLDAYARPVNGSGRGCAAACAHAAPEGSFALHRTSVPPGEGSGATAARPAARWCREQLRHCLPGAASFYKVDALRKLWLLRFLYTERLVRLGYNTLLLDSDSVVFANPSLSAYAVLCLHDATAWPHMRVNGGTWYFKRAPHGGAVARMLASFRERVLHTLDAYPAVRRMKRTPNGERAADWLLFDQTLINLALMGAALGRNVSLSSEEPEHLDRLVDENTGRPYRLTLVEQHSLNFETRCCFQSPTQLGHPPFGTHQPTGRGVIDAAAEARVPYGRHFSLRVLRLAAHPPLEAELVAKAPPWLFSAESDFDALGRRTASTHWGTLPPPAAVVHFVCSSWPGSDGRRAAMRLWGVYHEADVRAEMGTSYQRAERQRLRALVAFAAPLPVRSPSALQPFLRLLFYIAHATERTPVLPLLECSPPAGDPKAWAWLEPSVDLSGWPSNGGAAGRSCGWVVHHVGGKHLRRPLCVQRPLEASETSLTSLLVQSVMAL